MIEFELAAYLSARPEVSAIVDGRVFEGRAPQGTGKVARIVYRLLPGSTRHYHSTGPSGLVEADIELTLGAPTYAAARELYEVIREEIDGFSGTWGTTEINLAKLSTPASATGDPVHGDDVGFPAVRANVAVFYYEAV